MFSWILLIVAGLAELGWPMGFKLASQAKVAGVTTSFIGWLIFAVVMMGLSSVLLYLAQRHIPIGTAYMVWTGIGGVGTAVLGMALFGEPITIMRLLSLTMVMAGLIGLYVFR